jgi:hypothetical protein
MNQNSHSSNTNGPCRQNPYHLSTTLAQINNPKSQNQTKRTPHFQFIKKPKKDQHEAQI